MSKRSDPDLLALAGAVADGTRVAWSGRGGSRAVSGLKVIAALTERLGALETTRSERPRAPALFQWGHLDVVACIGEGASSEVFRAYDPLLDIDVALKLSRPDLGRRATAEWIAEARRLARLRHPNVVAVHGVDVHGGRAGIWLDLIEGESLQAWGERAGPLPARELCLTAIEICRGLSAIHDAGLLHRDLKPANLLRDGDGRILIADFGAAGSAALAGGELSHRGTPLAMAPELLTGAASSIASDLYGLGVVLFWLASARLPVEGDDLDELVRAHRRRAPGAIAESLREPLGAGLAHLLDRLLAVDPAQRPESARTVERALAQALQPAQAKAASTSLTGEIASSPGAGTAFDRLVAREAELAYLQLESRRAVTGHAHPVLLVGEAGTGKSTLMRVFGDWLATRGGKLARVALSGYPPGRRRLTTLLTRACGLADSGRDAADALADPAELARALLAAGGVPLVLCLDDLQHADSAERAQIRRLIAELRERPALVVGIVRADGDVEPAERRALFGDAPIGVLTLGAFSEPQSERAIAALLGAPDYDHEIPAAACRQLYRLSGGNPFFLAELLRHLAAGGGLEVDHASRRWRWQDAPKALPHSLELAALERCRSLPPEARALLDAAAVLGERFRTATLANLLALDDDAVRARAQPALAAGLLTAGGHGSILAFRHGLIQRALYEAMPPAQRLALHARCAVLLRDAGGADALATLSLHAERAGDAATAFAAGYAALSAARDEHGEALESYERLQALLDGGVKATAAQRLDVALGRLRALRDVGRLRDAQALAEALDHELPRRTGSIADARLRLALAETWFALGRHRAAVLELEPLIGDGERRGRLRRLVDEARLLAVRAQAALGEYRPAEHALREALASVTDPTLRIEMQALYGWCIALQGRLREADDTLDRTLRLPRNAAPALRAGVLRRLHWVKLCRGRYQHAYTLALDAHAAYRSAGDAMGQAKMSMSLGQTRLAQGLSEEALGFLNRTLLQLEDIGDRHCEAETLWLLGRANTELGRLAIADGHLERALALIDEVGDRDDEFRFLIEQARLRLAQDRAADALAAAQRARAIALELDSRDGAAFAEVEIANALLAAGDAGAALEHCEPAARTLRTLEAGECWRADWTLGRCRLRLDPPRAADAAMALASAHDAIERMLAELDPGDDARRARLRRTHRALIADAIAAHEQAGDMTAAARLRSEWLPTGASTT